MLIWWGYEYFYVYLCESSFSSLLFLFLFSAFFNFFFFLILILKLIPEMIAILYINQIYLIINFMRIMCKDDD